MAVEPLRFIHGGQPRPEPPVREDLLRGRSDSPSPYFQPETVSVRVTELALPPSQDVSLGRIRLRQTSAHATPHRRAERGSRIHPPSAAFWAEKTRLFLLSMELLRQCSAAPPTRGR